MGTPERVLGKRAPSEMITESAQGSGGLLCEALGCTMVTSGWPQGRRAPDHSVELHSIWVCWAQQVCGQVPLPGGCQERGWGWRRAQTQPRREHIPRCRAAQVLALKPDPENWGKALASTTLPHHGLSAVPEFADTCLGPALVCSLENTSSVLRLLWLITVWNSFLRYNWRSFHHHPLRFNSVHCKQKPLLTPLFFWFFFWFSFHSIRLFPQVIASERVRWWPTSWVLAFQNYLSLDLTYSCLV